MSEATEQSTTNKSFYNRISHVYDSIADANEHKAREVGEKMLALKPGERVLEIGFGTGNSLRHLAKAVGETGKACGIDVSEGMRDVAQKKVDADGLTNVVELKVGNATTLDWPDDSFDAAFMSFTLELFTDEDMDKVLAETGRVLKPGGRIAVVSMATVKEGEKDTILEKTYRWMHRHFPHIVDCRPIDLTAVLQRNGFSIIEEQRLTIWTMPVAAVLAGVENA